MRTPAFFGNAHAPYGGRRLRCNSLPDIDIITLFAANQIKKWAGFHPWNSAVGLLLLAPTSYSLELGEARCKRVPLY